ncbi:MAG: hypothetical protein E7555_05480 [Ruminococcaceae bacterium]|nr:hypothetical protein [Oscillospiraceae bacterium]
MNYKLETQEYYKIKTLWNNPYKEPTGMPTGYLKIAVLVEEVCLSGGEKLHWTGSADYVGKSLKDYFGLYGDEYIRKWYQKNSERIESLREKIDFLSTYSNDSKLDIYFYVNAVLYAAGMVYNLPSYFIHSNPSAVLTTLEYCIDFPKSSTEEKSLLDVFEMHAKEDFRTQIPLPFVVWKEMKENKSLESTYKAQFDKYAIVLFDFMVETAILIKDTLRDHEYEERVRALILSYYKYLKKEKLYLPKEIQEKIYNYI